MKVIKFVGVLFISILAIGCVNIVDQLPLIDIFVLRNLLHRVAQ